MSVTTIGLAPKSGQGDISPNKYSLVRTYKIICSTVTDDEYTIGQALPAIFSPHPDNGLFLLKNIHYQRQGENQPIWLADLTYEVPPDQQQNPQLDLPVITISHENYQVAAVASNDPDEQAICSSANEPFSPPPQMDKSRVVITIKRNVNVNTDVISNFDFADTINADEFWGFSEHQVKCQGPAYDGPKTRQNNNSSAPFYYLEETWTFHCLTGEDTWDLVLLDQGTYYISGVGPVYSTIKSAQGDPIVGLLNGFGSQSDTPVYLDPIEIYSEMTFADLHLPTSFAQAIPLAVGGG